MVLELADNMITQEIITRTVNWQPDSLLCMSKDFCFKRPSHHLLYLHMSVQFGSTD